MKKCTKCKTPKPLTDFHINKLSKDGRCPECKICKNQRGKKFYSNDWQNVLIG